MHYRSQSWNERLQTLIVSVDVRISKRETGNHRDIAHRTTPRYRRNEHDGDQARRARAERLEPLLGPNPVSDEKVGFSQNWAPGALVRPVCGSIAGP